MLTTTIPFRHADFGWSFSKRGLVRNHSNENEFDLHENGRAGETYFHMNGFARRFILTQRQ